ncbi:D-alanyl-D-alanine carboxypeptidase/D-alanyl-D-alanine-endopeptidase [Noviherbaspirillum denitrificans]|uniref:D-alanyl-D-alanine carboxypeptidase/D-alanyl-D-alanine endopeptidase n=1 Tax=Noviherbaspirillum denitrificans TaxID=1968433 RepID=UPI0030789257
MPPTVADALQRAQIPSSAVGVHVQELGTGLAVLSLNDTLSFSPASTMKLVTTNAALEILGPSFSWKTQAYIDGTLNGDVLQGDLIIKGGGDPKLVLENFWLFLRKIRSRGIREIRGNLLLDRTIFEDLAHDAARFDGDPLKPYNVGPDALLLNYKSLSFRFAPDPAKGNVQATVDPPLAAYPVQAPQLSNGECGDWRAKLNLAIDSNGARFNGVYPASCGERILNVHPYLMTHTKYFDLAFRRMWADLGGTLKGETRGGVLPPSARLVAEWDSVSLAEVIRDINKYSNNVMARQLLLTLAAQATKMPANTESGATVISAWLVAKGIAAPELSVENGSGLSRAERIAPVTLAKILAASFRSPTMPEFMASLPLVGYDGTMRKRLVEQSVAGKAHIKTGLLNDVRAIAGYVLSASGKRYVVVCIINHPNAQRGSEAQDALLQWVYERG